jgi:Ca2+-binding EF-hand superfamily protein
MRRFRFPAFFLMAIALVGCNSAPKPPVPTFSPNGEPLIGGNWPEKCEDAIGLWFDRLDTKHTGLLTYAELEADARRQFDLMDLRHNGKITAEELSRYRLSVMGGHYLSVSTPGQHSLFDRRNRDEDEPGDRLDGTPSRRNRDDDGAKKTDAFAALVTDQPDPVMTADTNMDGSVTWEEFRALVAQNFADFDRDHKGTITKAEVQTICDKGR